MKENLEAFQDAVEGREWSKIIDNIKMDCVKKLGRYPSKDKYEKKKYHELYIDTTTNEQK